MPRHWRRVASLAGPPAGNRRECLDARESAPGVPCRACAAASDTPSPEAPATGSTRYRAAAASVSRNMARRPDAVGQSRRRHPVPDMTLRLTDHLDHSVFDEETGTFEP